MNDSFFLKIYDYMIWRNLTKVFQNQDAMALSCRFGVLEPLAELGKASLYSNRNYLAILRWEMGRKKSPEIAGTAPICYDFCSCDSLLFTSFLNLVQKNLRRRRKFPVFFPGKVNLTVNGRPQRSFCKSVR